MNFTNIKQERETKIIEHNATDFETLSSTFRDFETESIYIQINGYDSGPDEPNDVIYGSTSLNASKTLGWHLQSFDEGIPLDPGQYYLVVNGIDYPDFGNLNFWWFFNDESPNFPNLYVASYYWRMFGGWTWRDATQNKPFLYKIIQRVNRTYAPENINMTAEIGGNSYPILNGTELGTGNLKIEVLNFSPNEEKLAINLE